MDYLKIIPRVILYEIANYLPINSYVALSSTTRYLREKLRTNPRFVQFMEIYCNADNFIYKCFLTNDAVIIKWMKEFTRCLHCDKLHYRALFVLGELECDGDDNNNMIGDHLYRIICKYGTDEQVRESHLLTNPNWNLKYVFKYNRVNAIPGIKSILQKKSDYYWLYKLAYNQNAEIDINLASINYLIYNNFIRAISYCTRGFKNPILINHLIHNIKMASIEMFMIIHSYVEKYPPKLVYVVGGKNYDVIKYMLENNIKFKFTPKGIRSKAVYNLLREYKSNVSNISKFNMRRWNIDKY